MEELETDILEQIVNQNQKVIVQYGAAWCGACKIVRPRFKELANDHQEVKFLYVDAENLPESRKLANVDNLPMFAGFVDGKLVKQSAGTKVESILGVLDEIAAN